MAKHPLNLIFRFVLEFVMLVSLGYWGWTLHLGIGRGLWAIGLPFAVILLWGAFGVPGDRPGKPPVAISGLMRLQIEALGFGGAVWALCAAQRQTWALVVGVILLLHYAVSYDRIIWLLKQK